MYRSSITYQLRDILTTGFSDSMLSFQVLTNFGAGFTLFGLSWLVFNRCTLEQISSGPERTLVRSTGRQRRLGAGRAWRLALVWKEFHFSTGGMAFIIIKFLLHGVIVGCVGYIFNYNRRGFQWDQFGIFLQVIMLVAAAIELSVYAARLFYEETKWKTLPALIALPHSIAWTGYSKIAGCLPALIPAACYFILGVVIAPHDFFEALFELIAEPGAWYVLAQFVLFLHAIVFFSLFLKWGALPLAFVLVFGLSNCCITYAITIPMMITRSQTSAETTFAVLALLEFLLALGFHPIIAVLLRRAASR